MGKLSMKDRKKMSGSMWMEMILITALSEEQVSTIMVNTA